MYTKLFFSVLISLLFNRLVAQQLVKDIRPGSYGSGPGGLIAHNGYVFFTADTTKTGNNSKLWRTDGTSEGTILLSPNNIDYGAQFHKKAIANGFLFFAATHPVYGFELFKTDGTVAGTSMVKDIFVGPNSSMVSELFAFNGNVYFKAKDGWDNTELWKSDGTAEGTVMVQDIRPGQYGSVDNTSNGETGSCFAVLNNELYFSAWDGSSAFLHDLWKTDGKVASRVKTSSNGSFARSPKNLITFNGNVYFSAYTLEGGNNFEGAELYMSDGTDEGTHLVKNINPTKYQDSSPDNFTIANNTLFFAAYDGVNGRELWKTDGTEEGTVLVKDIYPGSPGSMISPIVPFVSYNNSLYFSALYKEGAISYGGELMKSDGTNGGTVLVKDIYPGAENSYPNYFCEVGGDLFFSATNTLGAELWKTSGTNAGTSMVKDLNTIKAQMMAPSSFPFSLVNLGGVLYFSASNGLSGSELWKYDKSSVSSIEDLTTSDKDVFRLFPNPTNGNFQINNLNDSFEHVELKIINLLGNCVYQYTLKDIDNKIDISFLPSGIYLVEIKSDSTFFYQRLTLEK